MTLKKKVITASRWTSGFTAFRLIIQYAQIMILARLLAPSDFGSMAIIGSLIAVMGILADFGINSALIHFPTPSKATLSSLYWINLIFSIFVAITFIVLAHPLTSFFNIPEIAAPLLLMSAIFPISAIGNQFRILAEKELQFVGITLIDIASTSVAFLTAVIFAINEQGVYTFIAAAISSTTIKSLLLFIFLSSQKKPSLTLKLAGISKFFSFGIYKLGETLINTLNNQVDIFLAAYFSGATNIGVYSAPRDQNMNIANSFVNPVITRISAPAMAKLQHDIKFLKEVYLSTLRISSSINLPIYTFIYLFSTEIVAVLLGPQWKEAGFYMSIFALWGAIRSIGNPTGSLLYATGNVHRAFYWNSALILFTPVILFFSMSHGGLKGISIGMLAIQILIFIPAWRYLVFPLCKATLKEYLSQLTSPFVASIISCLTAKFLVDHLALEGYFLRIFCAFIISAPVYIGLSIYINYPLLKFTTLFFNIKKKPS